MRIRTWCWSIARFTASRGSCCCTPIAPAIGGATNFQAPSYSSDTGLLYLAYQDANQRYFVDAQPFESGRQYPGGRGAATGQPRTAGIKAIDPEDGHTVWSFPIVQGSLTAGVLATSGGVVFASSREGFLYALDARRGTLLWKFQTGAGIDASPISYAVNGKQYVAVLVGSRQPPNIIPLAPELKNTSTASMLFVFAL